MDVNHSEKSGLMAFFPLLLFVGIYFGAGITFELAGVERAFYQVPSISAMFIACIAAFCLGREKFTDKIHIFMDGIGESNVIMMLVIYMLAGGFSGIAAAMGARDAMVNLGVSLLPVRILAAGIFAIAAFMGIATGTSVGTISAVLPIAVGIAEKSGIHAPLICGACVGGALFGDNLSMISDTTIAATSTQGVEMKDKFRVNAMIAIPAAICTMLLLLWFGQPEHITPLEKPDFNFICMLPYLVVFVLAVIGIHAFIVLSLGILTAAAIGIATGAFGFVDAAQNFYNGILSMDEVFYLTLCAAGLSAIARHRGGIIWVIEKLKGIIRNEKTSQVVVAILVVLIDIATATNTIAIVLCGDLAKNMGRQYHVDPRKSASLLDVFSCVPQGLIPYSAQMLVASALTVTGGLPLSAFDIIPYVWYCILLGIFGVLAIFVPYADSTIRKHPWNWEKNCAESKAGNR